MPDDPVIQEMLDIRLDSEKSIKQVTSDPEKELKNNARKYSIQAHADKAPWSSDYPGIGPGLFEGLWGNGLFLNMAAQADEAPRWSIYPMMRDRYLDNLWKSEGIIAGTLYSMTARFGALPYKVDGPKRAKQRSNDLLHNFDAKKWALDLLTCDNGAFIEKIGPGRPDKALNRNLVLGLSVMDSLQCWRTFDPEFPVIYINPYTAAYHKIHYSRVIMASSMPVNRELARGIGFCAVSRTMRAIQIMRDIEIYKHEKVGGRFKRALGMIKGKGVTAKSINNTLDEHDQKQDSMGLTRFSQIPFLLVPDGDADILVKDLAGLPDGFNAKEDTDLYVNCIALGFGIDTREIWPATSTGATKADATVQHEKARGKGNGDIIQTAERSLNWSGLPDNVTMEYDYTDDEQDLMVAQLHTVEITNVVTLQQNGNLTPEQGNAVLIAKGVLDPDVLTIKGAEESDPATDADPDSGEENAPVDTPEQQTLPANTDQNGQQFPKKPIPGVTPPKMQIKGRKAAKTVEHYVASYQQQLEDLLDDEDLDLEEYEQAKEILKKKYLALLGVGLTTAAGLGLAGSEPSKRLTQKLTDMAKTSLSYFDGFVSDLVDAVANRGDVTVQDTIEPMKARLGSYAGTYWEAIWAGTGDAYGERRVKRELDPMAKHCNTCPDKEGIYESFEAMEDEVGLPGDGNDDCLGNCRCKILIETSPGSGDFQLMIGRPSAYTAPIIPIEELAA